MKIATVAYDKRGVIAIPPKVYTPSKGQFAPEGRVFTTDAGYWHQVLKTDFDELSLQAKMVHIVEKIEANNGSVTFQAFQPMHDDEGLPCFVAKLIYVIEEADHISYRRFAATIDKLGFDPEFTYPFDGVATYGPDYRTPFAQKLATLAMAEKLGDNALEGLPCAN